MSVLLEIQRRRSSLSKTNKRISEYILNHAEEFLNYTSMELAEHCETSSASIIRFVQSLGYKGLDDFKIELAKDISTGEVAPMLDTIIGSEDDLGQMLSKVQNLVNSATAELFYLLDKEVLAKAIELTHNARRIYLLGIGASSFPAYDLYHKFSRIDHPAIFNFDAHMMVEFMNYTQPDDVVIAFSYSGQSKEIIYPAQIAKERGTPIIAVTRQEPSQLSRLADYVICVPNTEYLSRVAAVSSVHTTMIVDNILYLGVMQYDYNKIEEGLVETHRLTQKMKVK